MYTDGLQDDRYQEGSLRRSKGKCQSRMSLVGWIGRWANSPRETYVARYQEVVVPPEFSIPVQLGICAQGQEDCRKACEYPDHNIQALALHVDNIDGRAGTHPHGIGGGQESYVASR